ncbi:hypothetical protein [Treponema brennaborense]|uniref:hypothetical protein n=1 Tax=Treponema brennaborense TaxID=81028 RepID=UPI0012EA29F2|nr:hypothetical protein [Treponema brennaborense]
MYRNSSAYDSGGRSLCQYGTGTAAATFVHSQSILVGKHLDFVVDYTPDYGKILRRIPVQPRAFIVLENDIRTPMQVIFNTPTASLCLGKRFYFIDAANDTCSPHAALFCHGFAERFIM